MPPVSSTENSRLRIAESSPKESSHERTPAAALDHALTPLASDLDPWQPSVGDPWDRRKAAHLLRRAGFGYQPEELDLVVGIGMDRAVDLLLSPERTSLQSSGYTVLPQGELLNLNTDVRGQRAQWVHEAVHTSSPLREKMALFWHDHFSVGIANSNNLEGPLQIEHVNIFRRQGLGNFKELLLAVTADPAMLKFLDNAINGRPRQGKPQINENYGRELLELYTMGEGNGYTQQDVVEASKCLTGWSLSGRNTFVYRSNYHVAGDKTVLGKRIASAGQREVPALLDVILGHPATARYTGGKIFEYFVADKAPATLLDELAARWRETDYDIGALMSVLLRSRYFYSDNAIQQLVKSPMDIVVGAIKHVGKPRIGRYRNISNWLDAMGLPLLRHTTPAGIAEGSAWLKSITTVARLNFAAELTRRSSRANFAVALDPWREIRKHNIDTVEKLVDHYLTILIGDGVAHPASRTSLIDFMNRTDTRVRKFEFTDSMVREKVTGLLHLVMSLPEYQLL